MDEAPTGEMPTHDAYGSFLHEMEASQLEMLPNEDIIERVKLIRDESTPEELKAHLRNDIIESNLRLIPFILKRAPKGIGVRPEELVGESFEVLNRCIDIWDPEYVSSKSEEPVKFSSYFANSLEKSLRSPRTIVEVGKPIEIPGHILNIAGVMRKARELFMQEEQREPNQKEWYKRAVDLAGTNYGYRTLETLTPSAFENAQRARLNGIVRIDKPIGRGNVDLDTLTPSNGLIANNLIDEESNTEDEVMLHLLKDETQDALAHLTQREKFVIEWRYGIGFDAEGKSKEPLSFEQVGRILGVTRERIRQIEGKALRKLRDPKLSSKLRSYVYEEDFGERKPNPFEVETDAVVLAEDEQKEKVESYNKKITQIADSAVGHGTPDDFFDDFSRLIYMANGNLRNTKKIFTGPGSHILIGMYDVIDQLGKTPLAVVEDIANFVVDARKERVLAKKSIASAWENIADFTYTEEDFNKWMEKTNAKLTRAKIS